MSIDPLYAKAQFEEPAGVAGYLDFKVFVTGADTTATVRINGELDGHTAPQLRSTLLNLLDDGTRHVTLDMGRVGFIDSTGLSVLVEAMKRLRDVGGTMVVTSATDATRKLFDITGVKGVLDGS